MTIGDIFKESWISIAGNKTRTFLTVLGIIIGVMAVVIMVAVGETVQKQIDDQFSALGSNTIVIRPAQVQTAGVRQGNRMTLTIQDAEVLRRLPEITALTPQQSSSAQIVFGNKNWPAQMMGVWPDYLAVNGAEVEQGAFFDMSAVRNSSAVAVLGPKIVRELDMGDYPIGQVIRISNVPFVVIGVLKSRGESFGGNTDESVIIPFSTLKKRFAGRYFQDSVQAIALKTISGSDNDVVIEQITAILRDRHKLKDDQQDDFQIMNMKQVMDTLNTVTGFMKMLLIAIASVSLLVGSIGIMNMMLVSVMERTREIGIRKAVGAKERHIMIQFLAESIMISSMGSFIGLLSGVVITQGVGRFVLGFPVPVSLWSVIISVVVALVVGIASGVFPAIKATKLNPIDSLRYE
ncbi:MAG: ABC transporter permease [Rickettsiales bacterium]|jgi:putative ABC transport system permease protein|nr:ABC transporter permease [Rickettsiales bacterium]